MKIIDSYTETLDKSKKFLVKPYNSLRISLFNFIEKLGYHITKNHYYSPIPDTKTINENLWLRESKLNGIELNEKIMLSLMSKFSKNFKEEYEKFPKEECEGRYYLKNSYFESLDAEIYYCMIRNFKPTKIIEVGAGFSTYLSAQALIENEKEFNVKGELTAIEPYPSKELIEGFPGLLKLIKSEVQSIEISKFAELKKNDILFIDSSHVVKIGGDVLYLILDVLPNIEKGVLIHIHDVFIPYEYPKEWVFELHRFWNEQYLLQSFLMFNDSFEVLWSSSYMNMNHSGKLKQAFNSYEKYSRWPSSFWIRRI